MTEFLSQYNLSEIDKDMGNKFDKLLDFDYQEEKEKIKSLQKTIINEESLELLESVESKVGFSIKPNPEIRESKINLRYKTSGSNGIILVEKDNPEYLYKISTLYDGKDFYSSNLVETIYYSFFKNKYQNPEEISCLPVQSESTLIIRLSMFIEKYNCDSNIFEKFRQIGISNLDDYLIIVKMKSYGKDLHTISMKNPNTVNTNFGTIIKNIIMGLALLHNESILHGDLKTQNLVYDNTSCKIIDFGGIKSTKSNLYQRTCTITTRPPEDLIYEYEIDGKQPYINYGARSEIWSLGVVFMELILKDNPIHKLYNRLMIFTKEECIVLKNIEIEIGIKNILKKKSGYDIFQHLDKEYLAQIESNLQIKKIIHIVNNMLRTNPHERYSSLYEIYHLMFDETMVLPVKKEEIIEILKSEIYLEIFNNFRKQFYPKIYDFLIENKLIYSILSTINIIDRFIIILLNNDNQEIIEMLSDYEQNYDKIILMLCGAITIGISVIYSDSFNMHDFIKILNLFSFSKNKLTDEHIIDIIQVIVQILTILEYDVIDEKFNYSYNDDFTSVKTIYEEYISFVNQSS